MNSIEEVIEALGKSPAQSGMKISVANAISKKTKHFVLSGRDSYVIFLRLDRED